MDLLISLMDFLIWLSIWLFTSGVSSNITTIVLFLPAVIGGTHIVVDSSIFTPVRDWLKERLPYSVYRVFECYQCSGYWVGVLCSFILLSYNPMVAFFPGGFAGSFLAVFGGTYLNYLEANTIVELPREEEDILDE